MRSIRSTPIILALMVLAGACAPAPTNTAIPLPPATNSAIPIATGAPATVTALPSLLPSPAANDQPFTEYISGTLWIHLFSPQDEAVVQSAQIFVNGQAPMDTVISVNDEIYLVSADQSFSIPVNLEEGPNVLEFVASDLSGNEVAFILTVTYEP